MAFLHEFRAELLLGRSRCLSTVPEVFLECQEVAFHAALLAVVLPCLLIEIQMGFSLSAILVAGAKKALGDEFISPLGVGDIFFIEIFGNAL